MPFVQGLNGAGNDDKHQIIIAYFIYYLINHFRKFKKYNSYFAVPELHLKPSSSSIPDITVWKKSANGAQPIIIFEVCWAKKLSDDIKKTKDIMLINMHIQEGFIINKENFEITKIYRKKDGGLSVPRKVATSEVLHLDFAKAVDILPI